ncbi:serine/threonine-protein kinase [Spirillospora sp. NPDC029432]|uniref:serine/threonine-protein kinase n=1 Tax=Spirillospora sp. NPDC029432 TaxID=3154599 RepID=UPI003452BD4B
MAPVAGWRVSGFDEVRELGRGAQGRVVLARHARAGTPVAIKYLAEGADPAARERFRDEARLLGRIDDPHVARLYRLVESEGRLAIVMEAVNGVPFKEILARYGTLGPEAALTVLKGSLLGLAAAHALGVVHRDYKPANVIVPADGNSKLIDFGVATALGSSAGAGTPLYMAPEQWRGEPATPATDVYAATCVFFECVTGRRPYAAKDRAAIAAGHLSAPVPAEEVPGPLRPLVERGMAKHPGARPESAAAFVAELEEVASAAYGPDWEARGVRALAGAAVALAALFPLAAGLLSGGAASAASAASAGAGSAGVLGALGTKTAAVVAGTAVAGSAAGGVGVYQAVRDEPERRPAAVAPAASRPPGRTMTVGGLSFVVPPAWRSSRISSPAGGTADNRWVRTPGPCRMPPFARDAPESSPPRRQYCPGFDVITEPWGNDGSRGWDLFRIQYPWAPETDVSHPCPPRADLFASIGGTRPPVRRGLVPVGTRRAEYREWRIDCIDIEAPTRDTNVSFIQRVWYLPQSKILVIDEWNTPGLAEILRKATWS